MPRRCSCTPPWIVPRDWTRNTGEERRCLEAKPSTLKPVAPKTVHSLFLSPSCRCRVSGKRNSNEKRRRQAAEAPWHEDAVRTKGTSPRCRICVQRNRGQSGFTHHHVRSCSGIKGAGEGYYRGEINWGRPGRH